MWCGDVAWLTVELRSGVTVVMSLDGLRNKNSNNLYINYTSTCILFLSMRSG